MGVVPVVMMPRIVAACAVVPIDGSVAIPATTPSPIGTAETEVEIHARTIEWVIIPWVVIPRVIVVYGDVCVAARVVVVIITGRTRCRGSEALDARGIVGVVVGFCGGVNHTVGVGHGFSGLIHRVNRRVVLAVGIIALIVVFRVLAEVRRYIRAIARCGCVVAAIVVRRVVNVVFGHIFLR